MPTSVHLPAELLEAVDQRARALKISRNQLVVRALEREVRGGNEWSPGFFEALSSTGPELTRDVDELLSHVRHARHSKPARRL
jgi:metal-responsive CopG/Arc/MetJ family transcriptional regulator